jgi:hypothetical protein
VGKKYVIGAHGEKVAVVLPIQGDYTPEEAIEAAAQLTVIAALVGYAGEPELAEEALIAAIERIWSS